MTKYPQEFFHALPCGAIGFHDGIGSRRQECMAVWGSIGCGCSNELQKREKAAKKNKLTKKSKTKV